MNQFKKLWWVIYWPIVYILFFIYSSITIDNPKLGHPTTALIYLIVIGIPSFLIILLAFNIRENLINNKRIYKDWKFWILLMILLIGIFYYLMSLIGLQN